MLGIQREHGAVPTLMETEYHVGEFEMERSLWAEQSEKNAIWNHRKQEVSKFWMEIDALLF